MKVSAPGVYEVSFKGVGADRFLPILPRRFDVRPGETAEVLRSPKHRHEADSGGRAFSLLQIDSKVEREGAHRGHDCRLLDLQAVRS